jgi:hypothetical protein
MLEMLTYLRKLDAEIKLENVWTEMKW